MGEGFILILLAKQSYFEQIESQIISISSINVSYVGANPIFRSCNQNQIIGILICHISEEFR